MAILKFDNIQPYPNPKGMTTERVRIAITTVEGKRGPVDTGYIRNSSVHPEAHTQRW